jgi:hypothetical protein
MRKDSTGGTEDSVSTVWRLMSIVSMFTLKLGWNVEESVADSRIKDKCAVLIG